MTVDSAGNVYVTGFSTGAGTGGDFTTIKYLPNGDTAWVRRHTSAGSFFDEGRSIAVDKNGNVYVTGRSDQAAVTIKYNPAGDTLWTRFILSLSVSIEANALAIDDSGNVYVTGFSGTNYITAKYHPNGDTAWVRYYGTSANASDVAVDTARNVYVTGKSSGGGTGLDFYTIKYAPNGDTLWVRRYNEISVDSATDVAVDDSGNVYVTGYSIAVNTAGDYATIKYAPNGDTLWVRRHNGPGGGMEDTPRALAVDKNGNVYVCGDVFTGASSTGYDYALIKYASKGDTLWARYYNSQGNFADRAFALAVDDAGNAYVTGESGFGLNTEYATVKYSPAGDTLWVRRYEGSGVDSQSIAYAINVDNGGNVYVSGGSKGSGSNFDYATIKYSQSPPALVIQAFSPVDLIVTDPNNDSIGLSFNTISGASYSIANDSIRIPTALSGNYKIKVKLDTLDLSGDTTYTLTVKMGGASAQVLASGQHVPNIGETQTFIITSNPSTPSCFAKPGDINGDNQVLLPDIISIINFLFRGQAAPAPFCRGDANGNGNILLPDIIYLINFLFRSGPAPVKTGACCL